MATESAPSQEIIILAATSVPRQSMVSAVSGRMDQTVSLTISTDTKRKDQASASTIS